MWVPCVVGSVLVGHSGGQIGLDIRRLFHIPAVTRRRNERTCGVVLADILSQRHVKLFANDGFYLHTPQHQARVVAVSFHHIIHVSQCQLGVRGVLKGLRSGVTCPTLEENLPHQEAVFVVGFHHFFRRRGHVFIGNHVHAGCGKEPSLVIHTLSVHV